jgi:hypothetical protein
MLVSGFWRDGAESGTLRHVWVRGGLSHLELVDLGVDGISKLHETVLGGAKVWLKKECLETMMTKLMRRGLQQDYVFKTVGWSRGGAFVLAISGAFPSGAPNWLVYGFCLVVHDKAAHSRAFHHLPFTLDIRHTAFSTRPNPPPTLCHTNHTSSWMPNHHSRAFYLSPPLHVSTRSQKRWIWGRRVMGIADTHRTGGVTRLCFSSCFISLSNVSNVCLCRNRRHARKQV